MLDREAIARQGLKVEDVEAEIRKALLSTAAGLPYPQQDSVVDLLPLLERATVAGGG